MRVREERGELVVDRPPGVTRNLLEDDRPNNRFEVAAKPVRLQLDTGHPVRQLLHDRIDRRKMRQSCRPVLNGFHGLSQTCANGRASRPTKDVYRMTRPTS